MEIFTRSHMYLEFWSIRRLWEELLPHCCLRHNTTKVNLKRRTSFFSTRIVRTSHNNTHLVKLLNINQKETLNSKMNLLYNHKSSKMIFRSIHKWRKNDVKYEIKSLASVHIRFKTLFKWKNKWFVSFQINIGNMCVIELWNIW